jgi:hypothetical protein
MGEHSASCLDMLMIKIQTARRKFTYLCNVREQDGNISSKNSPSAFLSRIWMPRTLFCLSRLRPWSGLLQRGLPTRLSRRATASCQS